MYEIILLQLLLQRVMTAPDHPMLNAFNQQLSRKDNMAAMHWKNGIGTILLLGLSR